MGEPLPEPDRAALPDRATLDGRRPLALVKTKDLLHENIELAEKELHRRLRSKQLRSEISDTTLSRLLVDLYKLRDRERSGDGSKTRTTNVLAIVQQEGLPLDRQIGLVLRAMEQARASGEPVDQFEQALRELAPDQPLLLEGGTNGTQHELA